jgi:thymidine kinase
MAKLYFRYGTVGSAKTLNLLAVAHQYRQQKKNVLLLKPAVDTRFGRASIKSRAGLQHQADCIVDINTDLFALEFEGIQCILVDEAQFLSPHHVDQLRRISLDRNIPVICYGLRTDFRTKLFPGTMRLMEVADSIEEVKATCHFCNKKATVNLKHVGSRACVDGPAVELGCEERYFPACFQCYRKELASAGETSPKYVRSEISSEDNNVVFIKKRTDYSIDSPKCDCTHESMASPTRMTELMSRSSIGFSKSQITSPVSRLVVDENEAIN